jgi:LCP family protein required for cell wall assembly
MSAHSANGAPPPDDSAAARVVRRSEPRGKPSRHRGKRRKRTHPWAKAILVTSAAVAVSLAIMYGTSKHPLQTVIGHLDSIVIIGGLVVAIAGAAAFRINHRRWIKGLVAFVAVGLLVLDGLGYMKIRALTDNIKSGKSMSSFTMPRDPTGGKALNILVMGTDTRDCAGCQIDNQHGGGGSDTTILIHISADRTWAEGISIPRDSMVSRPAGCQDSSGHTYGAASHVMWNAAYDIDYTCTIKQFIATTGIPLSHYVIVNFASFQSMVDALGGVTVCLPQKLDDSVANIHFPAGTQTLHGLQALQYVRVRHGIGDGSDLDRTHRQQAFIGSMVRAALSGSTMSNPTKLYNFLSAATKGLEMDPEFKNLAALTGVAGSLRSIGFSNVQFITIPYEAYPPDPNRVQWAQPQAQQVWDDIRNDKRLSSDLSNVSISANQVPTGSATASPTSKPTSSGKPTASATPSNTQLLHSVGLCS